MRAAAIIAFIFDLHQSARANFVQYWQKEIHVRANEDNAMETLTQALPRRRPVHWMTALWGDMRRRVAIARIDARLRDELRYELKCLDEAGELDGALANVGLSRAAIPSLLKNYPGCMRRFTAMTRRLGVGADRPPSLKGGLAALFGQRLRCLYCAERRTCERWLASDATEGNRDFCPNANSFERMKKRA